MNTAIQAHGTREVRILKAAAKTEPKNLAGALAPTLREDGIVIIELMGNDALTNAIAAVTICRGYLASTEEDCIVVPSFRELKVTGESGQPEDRKGIRLTVEKVNGPIGGHAAIYEAGR